MYCTTQYKYEEQRTEPHIEKKKKNLQEPKKQRKANTAKYGQFHTVHDTIKSTAACNQSKNFKQIIILKFGTITIE